MGLKCVNLKAFAGFDCLFQGSTHLSDLFELFGLDWPGFRLNVAIEHGSVGVQMLIQVQVEWLIMLIYTNIM